MKKFGQCQKQKHDVNEDRDTKTWTSKKTSSSYKDIEAVSGRARYEHW